MNTKKTIYRWAIVILGFIGVFICLYYVYPLPQSSYPILFITGIIALTISYLSSFIAPKLDINNRFSYDELEDYEPNLWFIKTFGTRIIKSKSNPYVVYTFFHLMFVPIVPIRCHGYTFEKSEYSQDAEIYWCGAKWNILDIAIIYWRWIGYALIFAGLVKVFS